MKLALLITLITFTTFTHAEKQSVTPLKKCQGKKITRVVVNKHDREMHLICKDRNGNERIVNKYKVMLGKEPVGPKQQQGDNKTPEGEYTLDWKLKNSSFHRALHVSYPNKQDKENAKKLGIRNPGSAIMVHGMPNKVKWTDIVNDRAERERVYKALYKRDWTAGCIAVTNSEMEEIYGLVDVLTPILINP